MATLANSRADLLRTLEQFALLTPEQLAKARNLSGGVREVLTSLVQQGLLTRFQADAIERGTAEQLRFANFTLVDILGDGAMGTVYKALSTRDGNLYALRTVPRKNVVNLKAVLDKVEALKQVRHPRVSAMVAVGAQGDRVYMAWPYLDGGIKLDEVIHRQGRLPAKQSVQVALQVASGLQAYHQHELFHGLLKPGDILIGSDRRVRILDFGVGFLLTCERGKSLLSTMTNGKALARGLDCASPESIVDPLQRTVFGDQYSLGCVMYFCLTGQFPFPDKNPVKKMLGHQFEQAVPIKELAPETPPKLVAIVERLLAKLPEERYASTDDLVAELQAVSSNTRGASVPANWTPPPKPVLKPSALLAKEPPRVDLDPPTEAEPPPPPAAAASSSSPVAQFPWGFLLAATLAGVGTALAMTFLKG